MRSKSEESSLYEEKIPQTISYEYAHRMLVAIFGYFDPSGSFERAHIFLGMSLETLPDCMLKHCLRQGGLGQIFKVSIFLSPPGVIASAALAER